MARRPPLCLNVNSDYVAADDGGRFILDGYDPHDVAPVVMGVVDATATTEKGRAALARLRRGIQG